jgi:DNA-binding MarR family transcriptional regulator
MMLDLLAARLEGRGVRTSSLCIAAGVPGTTALRWIRELTERGLFVRVPDPLDRRGILIELSPDAAERMIGHLTAGAQGFGA